MGLFPNRWNDLRRKSRIHSGSPFIHDISLMTFSSTPLVGLKT